MTSPVGAGQPGDARRALAQLAGRRADRSAPPPSPPGEQPDWFDADPPTSPLPAIPPAASTAPPTSAPPTSGPPTSGPPTSGPPTSAPPARPAPAVPPAAARLTAWPPPGLRDEDDRDENEHDRGRDNGTGPDPADTASPPTVGGALRALRSLWAPRTSRAKSAPLAVRRSYRWWLTAMVVGVAALAVSVVAAWNYQDRTGVSLAGGADSSTVLTELGALLLASIVVARLRAGDDWARTALALVGGLVALLSGLTAASNISFVSSTPAYFRTAEALLRLAQAAAAGLGIWYMFQPGAARHFDPRRGA